MESQLTAGASEARVSPRMREKSAAEGGRQHPEWMAQPLSNLRVPALASVGFKALDGGASTLWDRLECQVCSSAEDEARMILCDVCDGGTCAVRPPVQPICLNPLSTRKIKAFFG